MTFKGDIPSKKIKIKDKKKKKKDPGGPGEARAGAVYLVKKALASRLKLLTSSGPRPSGLLGQCTTSRRLRPKLEKQKMTSENQD